MTRKIFALVVLIVAVASLAACETKNLPIGPTPTTCEDNKATNFGGPLPCTYPVVSTIHIEEVSPSSGSTVNYDHFGPSNIKIVVKFAFDPMIPGLVSVQGALSADCSTVIPNSAYGIRGGTSGTYTLSAGLQRASGIEQTKCVVARIVTLDSNNNVLTTIVEERTQWIFNFQ